MTPCTKPLILGIAGDALSHSESMLFKKYPPRGYILFKRNCISIDQIKNLTQSLKDISGPDCPILIDQEGGRVSRLKAPYFTEFPAPATFKTPDEVYENARSMAKQIKNLGINVNCTPLVDLVFADTHHVIGDRSFGCDPIYVGLMAAAVVKAHLDENIIPVIKHIPGHGRAVTDSHEECPVVHTPKDILEQSDFEAFRQTLKLLTHKQHQHIWGMTAHVIYASIDSDFCATQSRNIIQEIIRHNIGFKGTLISDCITMKALTGTMVERAKTCWDAGCDLVLHCSADIDEMSALLESYHS